MAPDLEPAARSIATVVAGVRDDQLAGPTPCTDYSVGALLDHIGSLTEAFTRAARKESIGPASIPPLGDPAHLDPAWRTSIPAHLDELVQAWRDPGAVVGMTQAGGIDMPGEIAAVVALEELVVHGWDLAKATGQPYSATGADLDAVVGFLAPFAHDPAMRGDAYGEPRPAPPEASPLDRAVALAGRDPAWTPPSVTSDP